MLTIGARRVLGPLWPGLLRMCRRWLLLWGVLLLLRWMLLLWARGLLHGGVHGGLHGGVHGGLQGGGSRHRAPQATPALLWLLLLLLLLHGRWLREKRRHQRSSRARWAVSLLFGKASMLYCSGGHCPLQPIDARSLKGSSCPSSHQTGLSPGKAIEQVVDVVVGKLLLRRKLGMANIGSRWRRGKDKRWRSRNRRSA